MKTKLVLWGKNAQDERVLIALALRAKENKVDLYTFPEALATEEFSQQMLNEWRNGVDIPFPEGFSHQEKELSVTESLLPEDLKVERGDLVQRAQTEWHFIVLSSKLNETYQSELQDIKEKIEKMTAFSADVWEELKGFWSKVQTQVRDRNLFREHANDIRDTTNELFGKMKELRKSLDKEFTAKSEEHLNKFKESLGELKDRLEKGLNLNGIFEDLKNMQREFRDTKLTRDHRSSIWEKLDGLFKEVKAKRYGGDPNSGGSSPGERLKRRYEGLIGAIAKMEQSINRDKKELEFQERRSSNSGGQLEAQLREAKMMMINERIRSKGEKFNEMLQTKAELEKRMESQKEKDARHEERERVRLAKEEAAQRIKDDIKAAEKAREEDSEKLEKAAEALKKKEKVKKAPAEESTAEKITNSIEDSLTDVVDTVRAIAHVVGEKMDKAVENFKSDVKKEPEVAAKDTDSSAKDDLKIVEGIGPKIEELLHNSGIHSFADLENAGAEKLENILADAGGRYKSHNPSTWSRQAGLAAVGKIDELKKWQDELDGGKEVKADATEEE